MEACQEPPFQPAKRKETSHYGKHLKIKIGKFPVNRIPSDGEEESGEWSDLTPSIPSSPEVATFVDKLNKNCEASAPDTPPDSPPVATIGETLQLLDEMESRDSATRSPLPMLRTPPRSPFEEGMVEDIPLPNPPAEKVDTPEEAVVSTTSDFTKESCQNNVDTPLVTTETVSESGTPPVPASPEIPHCCDQVP